jgi:hypothetical protein
LSSAYDAFENQDKYLSFRFWLNLVGDFLSRLSRFFYLSWRLVADRTEEEFMGENIKREDEYMLL